MSVIIDVSKENIWGLSGIFYDSLREGVSVNPGHSHLPKFRALIENQVLGTVEQIDVSLQDLIP
jgi:hypothetical protein